MSVRLASFLFPPHLLFCLVCLGLWSALPFGLSPFGGLVGFVWCGVLSSSSSVVDHWVVSPSGSNEPGCGWLPSASTGDAIPDFSGYNFKSACLTIQYAINQTGYAGETIWLDNGLYYGPGNVNIKIGLKPLVIRSIHGPTNCILTSTAVMPPPGSSLPYLPHNFPSIFNQIMPTITASELAATGIPFDQFPLHTFIQGVTIQNVRGDIGAIVNIQGVQYNVIHFTQSQFRNNSGYNGGSLISAVSAPVVTNLIGDFSSVHVNSSTGIPCLYITNSQFNQLNFPGIYEYPQTYSVSVAEGPDTYSVSVVEGELIMVSDASLILKDVRILNILDHLFYFQQSGWSTLDGVIVAGMYMQLMKVTDTHQLYITGCSFSNPDPSYRMHPSSQIIYYNQASDEVVIRDTSFVNLTLASIWLVLVQITKLTPPLSNPPTVKLSGVRIEHVTSESGIFGHNRPAIVEVNNSYFINNFVSDWSTSVQPLNDGVDVRFYKSVFKGNSGPFSPILVSEHPTMIWTNLSVDSCYFEGNSVIGGGGGAILIGMANIEAKITNSIFVGNLAGVSGGGITVNLAKSVLIENCTFHSNSAPTGGSIQLSRVSDFITLRNIRVTGSLAVVGGAIFIGPGVNNGQIINAYLANNTVKQTGGAVMDQSLVYYQDIQFIQNTAEVGAAVYVDRDGLPTNLINSSFCASRFNRVVFQDNQATTGASIYVNGGDPICSPLDFCSLATVSTSGLLDEVVSTNLCSFQSNVAIANYGAIFALPFTSLALLCLKSFNSITGLPLFGSGSSLQLADSIDSTQLCPFGDASVPPVTVNFNSLHSLVAYPGLPFSVVIGILDGLGHVINWQGQGAPVVYVKIEDAIPTANASSTVAFSTIGQAINGYAFIQNLQVSGKPGSQCEIVFSTPFDTIKATIDLHPCPAGYILSSASSSCIPRPLYLDGEFLVSAIDWSDVVLAFVGCSLGAWASLTILEQAIGSRHTSTFPSFIGWTILSALSWCGPAVYSGELISLFSLKLSYQVPVAYRWTSLAYALLINLCIAGASYLLILSDDVFARNNLTVGRNRKTHFRPSGDSSRTSKSNESKPPDSHSGVDGAEKTVEDPQTETDDSTRNESTPTKRSSISSTECKDDRCRTESKEFQPSDLPQINFTPPHLMKESGIVESDEAITSSPLPVTGRCSSSNEAGLDVAGKPVEDPQAQTKTDDTNRNPTKRDTTTSMECKEEKYTNGTNDLQTNNLNNVNLALADASKEAGITETDEAIRSNPPDPATRCSSLSESGVNDAGKSMQDPQAQTQTDDTNRNESAPTTRSSISSIECKEEKYTNGNKELQTDNLNNVNVTLADPSKEAGIVETAEDERKAIPLNVTDRSSSVNEESVVAIGNGEMASSPEFRCDITSTDPNPPSAPAFRRSFTCVEPSGADRSEDWPTPDPVHHRPTVVGAADSRRQLEENENFATNEAYIDVESRSYNPSARNKNEHTKEKQQIEQAAVELPDTWTLQFLTFAFRRWRIGLGFALLYGSLVISLYMASESIFTYGTLSFQPDRLALAIILPSPLFYVSFLFMFFYFRRLRIVAAMVVSFCFCLCAQLFLSSLRFTYFNDSSVSYDDKLNSTAAVTNDSSLVVFSITILFCVIVMGFNVLALAKSRSQMEAALYAVAKRWIRQVQVVEMSHTELQKEKELLKLLLYSANLNNHRTAFTNSTNGRRMETSPSGRVYIDSPVDGNASDREAATDTQRSVTEYERKSNMMTSFFPACVSLAAYQWKQNLMSNRLHRHQTTPGLFSSPVLLSRRAMAANSRAPSTEFDWSGAFQLMMTVNLFPEAWDSVTDKTEFVDSDSQLILLLGHPVTSLLIRSSNLLNQCVELSLFVRAVEMFRQSHPISSIGTPQTLILAAGIYETFIREGSAYEVNISATMKRKIIDQLRGVMLLQDPYAGEEDPEVVESPQSESTIPSDIFDEAVAEIESLIGRNSFTTIISNGVDEFFRILTQFQKLHDDAKQRKLQHHQSEVEVM